VQKVSVQSILVIILYVLNNKKYKSIKFKVKSFKKSWLKSIIVFVEDAEIFKLYGLLLLLLLVSLLSTL